MNFQTVFALLFSVAILAFGIQGSGDSKAFLNYHAILIVFGGTLAAVALTFQFDRLLLLIRIFVQNFLGRKRIDNVEVVKEVLAIAHHYHRNDSSLGSLTIKNMDPFLAEAVQMVQDDSRTHDEIIDTLKCRVATMYHKQTEEVLKFRAIAKYPPALGLLGTTLSMIRLLQRLGDPDAQKLIGMEMALGLIATFYGLVLANFVFIPVAESLADSTRRLKFKNTIIVEGLRAMLKGSGPIAVADRLNSFLAPSERLGWQTLGDSGTRQPEREAA